MIAPHIIRKTRVPRHELAMRLKLRRFDWGVLIEMRLLFPSPRLATRLLLRKRPNLARRCSGEGNRTF